MPGMRAPLHHRGDRGIGRGQAQRGDRTVQPGEGHSRSATVLSGQAVRGLGTPEIPSHEVGLAILGPLRELDEVAYLRFASVYRSFSSAEDFEREIEALRAHRAGA
jgi:transcriptional regulator NrdR family protein